MTSIERLIPDPDHACFLAAVSDFAAAFGWRPVSFKRADEWIALVALDHDPSFEQMIWTYDPARAFVRCLLVHRGLVPAAREREILELCARINDGLAFGCAEYSFGDRTLVFRDSLQIEFGTLSELLTRVSARLLDLGSRYSAAVQNTLAGMQAAEAIAISER